MRHSNQPATPAQEYARLLRGLAYACGVSGHERTRADNRPKHYCGPETPWGVASTTGTKVALSMDGGPQRLLHTTDGSYTEVDWCIGKAWRRRRATVHITAALCVKLTKVFHCYTRQILL